MQRELAIDNVERPGPAGWASILFGTHPTTVDRIGAALTWSKDD